MLINRDLYKQMDEKTLQYLIQENLNDIEKMQQEIASYQEENYACREELEARRNKREKEESKDENV